MRHGFRITRRDIDAAERSLSKTSSGAKGHGSVTEKAVSSFETLAAAFGMGLLQGRFGGPGKELMLGPVPYELLGFLGLTGAGLFGFGGNHLLSLGNGLGATYAHTMGGAVGNMLAAKEGKPLMASKGENDAPAGALGAKQRGPLTESELRAMARAVR